MAFFPRSFYQETPSSFTPLFRLLDDFDSYSRRPNNGYGTALPQWQPKFDVRETNEAYELHGELPGVTKENVEVEFSDPQTMLIRGKTERVYTAGTPPTGQLEGSSNAEAITQGDESPRSHKATVEDENENQTPQPEAPQEVVHQHQQRTPTDNAKYWLTERSIGEFSRSFSFPTRVEQDGVSASFKDGILTVTVPKAKKHEARRIAVN